MPDTVDLFGESFRLSEDVDEFTLLEFAEAADDAEDNSLAAMAAMMRLLRASVHEEDWPRFRRVCRKNKAGVDNFLPIIRDLFHREVPARPTERPSDSSGGPPTTLDRSTEDSSSRAIARLEDIARPDLALFVVKAARDRASA